MRVRVLSLWALPLLSAVGCTKNSSKTPAITPLAECTADGQIDCFTTEAFPATVKAAISAKAGEIRASTTLGGVAGTLAACAGDNGTNCVTSAEYPSVVKSALTAAGIKSGAVVAGITGTYAPACTTDGQTDCLTGTDFKAGDTSSLTAFDVRAGKTIGGFAAKLAFNRNSADTSSFNRTAGAGAVASATVADSYDSVDDYNNGGAFPTTKPATWPSLTSNWVRDAVSDSDGNTECNLAEECVYIDKVTNLYWARSSGSSVAWEAAISACESLSWGTYTNWRMPSQKELFQAYINGIFSLKNPLNMTQANYQSSTTLGLDSTKVYSINLATGEGTAATKVTTARSLCVR